MGGLDVHRRRVLLLRHAVHNWVRRPGTGKIVPGHRHAKRTAAVGRMLRLLAVRPGPDRHVVLARPRGGRVQVQARCPLRRLTQTATPTRDPAVRFVIPHVTLIPSPPPYLSTFIVKRLKTKIIKYMPKTLFMSHDKHPTPTAEYYYYTR